MPEVVAPEQLDNPVPAGTNEGAVEVKSGGESAETQGTRFDGKTPEELKQIATEQDKQIGKLGSEVGKIRDLEQAVNYLRGALESRQQYVPEAPTPARPPKAEFDLSNPDPYIDQAVTEKLDSFRRELAQRDAQNYLRSARYNMEKGRTTAMEKNKELFAGIENEVAGAIAQQVKSGTLAPELLGDPMTWRAAATLLRITRGEDDKIVPQRRGMAATDLGSPARARASAADEDDIQLSSEDRQWMRDNGLDEKTVLDGIKRGRQMMTSGDLKIR